MNNESVVMTKMQKMRSILLFAICAGVNFGARGMESKEEENQEKIDPVIWHYLIENKEGGYKVLLGKHLADLGDKKVWHIIDIFDCFRIKVSLCASMYGSTQNRHSIKTMKNQFSNTEFFQQELLNKLEESIACRDLLSYMLLVGRKKINTLKGVFIPMIRKPWPF